ncbi:MAG: thioredoxin family protein [Lewinella sp.]|nr:thioredoxin family protein [Lewinella sp.]
MHIRERVIHFQNRAEANYASQPSLRTGANYSFAFLTFLGSNLLALLRLPWRMFRKPVVPLSVKVLTERNIDEMLQHEEWVLIDCWAAWCGPCMLMEPIIEAFAEATSTVAVGKVNGDTHPDLLRRFGVKGLPTLLLFHRGEEVKRHAGPLTRAELERFCALENAAVPAS